MTTQDREVQLPHFYVAQITDGTVIQPVVAAYVPHYLPKGVAETALRVFDSVAATTTSGGESPQPSEHGWVVRPRSELIGDKGILKILGDVGVVSLVERAVDAQAALALAGVSAFKGVYAISFDTATVVTV